jgi:putative MATE family efflux protein
VQLKSAGVREERAPAAMPPRRPGRDLTQGSLLRSLLVLATPLLASSLVGGVLFQLVDLKLVSGLGADATTAVVVTNQSIRQLFFMLVMGASFGAQGLIARSIGAGQRDAADHAAGQVIVLGALVSGVVAVVGAAFPAQILASMNVSPAVLEVGTPYVRLALMLSFGLVFGVLFGSILNGAGDTTTPLVISIVQTAVSLVAEWCLMFGRLGLPALGIRGAAFGLGIGQSVGIALALAVLFSGRARVHLRRHHLRPDPALLARIAALSWPPALQMIGGFLVTVFFLRTMGDFGEKAQAAYSIGLRLGMVGPMLAFPLAGASAILVGQSLGSGNVPRAWRALFVGLGAHATLLWTVGAAVALFRTQILQVFSTDPEVVRIGSELMLFQAGSFFAWGLYFVFFRALQAAGDVTVSMLLSLGSSLLVTLPLGLALARSHGPTGVFTAGLVGSVVVTTLTGLWVATGRWTRRFRVTPSAHA